MVKQVFMESSDQLLRTIYLVEDDFSTHKKQLANINLFSLIQFILYTTDILE
jgi:hypothetical protein